MFLVVGTAVFLAAAIGFFGHRRVGFSHWRHTISELGERGAADGRVVSWGVFLPVGLALAGTWLLHRHAVPQAAALAGVIAIGYVGAAIFPCDPGSPAHGSIRQTLHNIAGGVEYVGGVICLLALGREHVAFLVPAAVVAISVPLISMPIGASVRGIAQRVAEVSLFAALAFALRLPTAT